MGNPTQVRLGLLVIFVAASFLVLANVMPSPISCHTAYTVLRQLPDGVEVCAYAAPRQPACAAGKFAKLVVARQAVGLFGRASVNKMGAALIETLSADGTLRPVSGELRPWSARSRLGGNFFWSREVFIDVVDGDSGPSEAQLREAHLISRSSVLSHLPSWIPPATMFLVFLFTLSVSFFGARMEL